MDEACIVSMRAVWAVSMRTLHDIETEDVSLLIICICISFASLVSPFLLPPFGYHLFRLNQVESTIPYSIRPILSTHQGSLTRVIIQVTPSPAINMAISPLKGRVVVVIGTSSETGMVRAEWQSGGAAERSRTMPIRLEAPKSHSGR
jgi:hypothetical protein